MKRLRIKKCELSSSSKRERHIKIKAKEINSMILVKNINSFNPTIIRI